MASAGGSKKSVKSLQDFSAEKILSNINTRFDFCTNNDAEVCHIRQIINENVWLQTTFEYTTTNEAKLNELI